MGKCGGRELNYISDVDVIFVAEPADGRRRGRGDGGRHRPRDPAHAHLLGPDAGRPLWQVDPALRPEGKNGPLVRTLASHKAYYERWAKTWEFQALLKARPVAGDPASGRATARPSQPLVWRPSTRENFVEDVQAMRRRVEQHIRPAEADRQLKLGPGGLRDVEFTVQLLQLVHGRADESLRTGTTLDGARRPVRRAGTSAATTPRRSARLPAAAHPRAPHPAVPAAPHPPHADRRERPAPARPRARPPRGTRGGGRRAVARPSSARCAGCTSGSSTARCSPRPPGSSDARCA